MIKDEFTYLKGRLSRQRLWQLRKQKLGLCTICGKKKVTGKTNKCKEHLRKYNILQREWQRKDLRLVKRILSAKSYRNPK